MMSNHIDMQGKYCGHCSDTHPMQTYTKENHKSGGAADGHHICILALNVANVVAITTILVLHVGVIGHYYVPGHDDVMFPRRSCHAHLRARGVRGALPPRRGSGGAFGPPREAGGSGRRHAPQWWADLATMLYCPSLNY